ncbi:MAG: hypothetical protein C5B55_00665 [Blastocatellia bacterium]|nr:MAG: hypothetical protein C5B55_00665 [Blastocatellia bacterium]
MPRLRTRQLFMFSLWPDRSQTSKYLVAVGSTVLVILLRFALATVVGDAALFFPFILAVTLTACYGGFQPGLLATFLGAVAAVFFFVPPYYSFAIPDSKLVVTLIFFIIASITISLVCDALRRALRRAEASERKTAEHLSDLEKRDEALQDVQTQLQIITDSMSALVTRCTRDLKYAWVSRPYAEWLNLTREQIIGANIVDIIGDDAFKKLGPSFERALQGEVVEYEEQINYGPIGSRWIHAVYTPTFSSDKSVDGWVAVVIDIDPQKKAEEVLRATDRRKDNFLAILAHELRNPLAPLRHSLALLKDPNTDSSSDEYALEVMDRQLSHMVRLVDDLLDLSRINSDKIKLQIQTVSLADVVSQAVETVKPIVAAAGHRLVIDLPPERLQLNADTVRLSQAFSNLLNNACKFTEPGGEISLRAVSDNGDIVVSVADNGFGIPADISDSIFGMFTQADQTIERKHGGLGIGLALVKRLVDMHGGSISVRNRVDGVGAEFTVRLPVSIEASPIPPLQSQMYAKRESGLNILVVDDNVDAAESLSMLMQVMGNKTQTANDGEEALRLASKLHPDVVLLDVGLPKMNGYDVARAIRQQTWAQRPILIAITGWGQTEDKANSKEAGFDHHVVKPVDPDVLLELISETRNR